MWNFVFADDAPDKKETTLRFFGEIKQGKFEIYISDAVEFEINAASTEKKRLLLGEIEKYKPAMLNDSLEARRLTLSYIDNGILSSRQIADLSHIAVATVNNMDVIVSWNMKHIVRKTTSIKVNAINLVHGYHEVEICTPNRMIGVSENDNK